MIQVTVSMDEAGGLVITNAQGDLLEGFFRAEDETYRELQLLGYQRLIHTYGIAAITAGHGIDQDDLGEVFLEG